MATKKTKTGVGKTSKKAVREEEFDSSAKHVFRTDVIPGPGLRKTIEVKCKGETYDDLLDAFEEVIKRDFPEEYFPKLDFDYDSFRIVESGKEYPVYPESEAKKRSNELQKGAFDKYLVLPECMYSIAPEYKLYMSLCENGMIDGETTPYDRKKMAEILAGIGEGTEAS